jgi:hypothetical protein
METTILKKRLNTFKSGRGRLKRVSDDLLIDLLRSYEQWPGSAADFYRDVGISKQQFAVLMKKAKKLCREGQHPESGEFKEIALAALGSAATPPGVGSSCAGSIELQWAEGRVIRFPSVEPLLEFLKKAA